MFLCMSFPSAYAISEELFGHKGVRNFPVLLYINSCPITKYDQTTKGYDILIVFNFFKGYDIEHCISFI